jgi:endoglycosylceramidase
MSIPRDPRQALRALRGSWPRPAIAYRLVLHPKLPLRWLPVACALALGCDLGIPGVPPPPGADGAGFRLSALHAEPDPVNGGRLVDAHGREVVLRGVNVNALVEYWAYDPARFTVYPFADADADAIAAHGFNAVRLLLSWSRVEPEPGVYDEAYLDEAEAAVLRLQSRGVWAIVDLHQDAWGATLAARPGEDCSGTLGPAFGWDGAPGWATLDGGARRCVIGLTREFAPAVLAAFQAFWADQPAPADAAGLGIRTRYVRMLGHVAARFSRHDAVAGYDVMNEPNAWWFAPGDQLAALGDLYGDALAEIRAAEDAAGTPHRLLFFEPAAGWPDAGPSLPAPFPHDGQIVFAPHPYRGGLDERPLDRSLFEQARADAALFGGAPVLAGEWGSDPRRAADPNDDYFELHQAFQDEFRMSATIWTWREACGDPHKAGDVRDGRVPYVWGFFEVDCTRDEVTGVRAPLMAALRRPALLAAPGPIARLEVDAAKDRLVAEGDAQAPSSWIAFLPGATDRPPRLVGAGLGPYSWRATHGGIVVYGFAGGGAWRIQLAPGP